MAIDDRGDQSELEERATDDEPTRGPLACEYSRLSSLPAGFARSSGSE